MRSPSAGVTSTEGAQAGRPTDAARRYGRYLEEFEVGAVYRHRPSKTVNEADNRLFCLLTMNTHPVHADAVYAAHTQHGRNVVAEPYVYSLALGMSSPDISGQGIANLATDALAHPNPVFPGDTLSAETEVLQVRASASKADRGIVEVHSRVFNQEGALVAEFKRLVLVRRKPVVTAESTAHEPAPPSPQH